MSFASPMRSSNSLDGFTRVGSSDRRNSTGTLLLTKSLTKLKKLQSAEYDKATGIWECKKCRWAYSHKPGHHERRDHKKICPGEHKVQHWLSRSSGLSVEEASSDTSNVVDKPTTPETSDTASTKLSLRQRDRNDGANRVRDGDLAKTGVGEFTGEGVQAPRLLDREFKAHETPSRNELQRESEVQEVGDAKTGSHGEQILSEQPRIVGSGENSRILGDPESGNEKVFKPRIDDPGKKQSSSDSSLLHDPSQKKSDQMDFSAFPNAKKQKEDIGLTVADNQAEVMPKSEDSEMSFRADDNEQKEKAELMQVGDESQLILTEDGNAKKQREEMGEGSGEADAMLTASDGVPREQEEDVGMEEAFPTSDEDGKDYVKHNGLNAVAGDGMDYKKRDEHQSRQSVRDVGNEALQNGTLQGQSHHPKHATEEVGDLHGHEIERDDTTVSAPVSVAEGVHETPNPSRGVDKFSGAQRKLNDWEHVGSGENRFGENKKSPLLQDIDDAGQPFSVDGLTSHAQPDHLEHGSAEKSAPIPEKAGAVLKSDQDAANQIGSRPEGQDSESLLDKSVDQQLGDSLGSTSSDHHFRPNQDGSELIPGLDQEEGGNVDQVATTTPASQEQTDQTNEVPVRLSAAEANWDDWDDVIKEVPMLIDGLTSQNAQDPESSPGERQTPGVESLGGGDVSEPGQGKTGITLQSESVEGLIDTAPAGLPFPILESERSDWLIDFSEPSAEYNSGAANEAIPALNPSTPQVEDHGTNFFLDLLSLNEDSGQERGASSLDSIPVTSQSETGQNSKILPKMSSALRNWDDWEHVVRENERVNDAEVTSPVLGSDLGVGEHQSGLEAPSLSDKHAGESGSIKVAVSSLPKNQEFPDSGLGRPEGKKGMDDDKDTSRHESGQAGIENLPSAQRDWDDWVDVQNNEYVPGGSRHSSPSFEDTHDGELSSENEYPNGHKTAGKLPLGERRWADWEDLANSAYMVLDGPAGESLIFKRASDARGSPLSSKSLRGRESRSFEEPDDDSRSPRLRRIGQQPPSFDDDISPSFRPLKGVSPVGVVTSDYAAGSLSFQGFDTTPRSLQAFSPKESEARNKPSLVSTRGPLLYRDSRRDYTSEIEDMDATNEPHRPIAHHHVHDLQDQKDALKYDVEKVLRGQTKYELICPICGAIITRRIVIRKKKRRFISEGDPRWKRNNEITPVDDDGKSTPRSDVSSDVEDASAAWKQGIGPCLNYFFRA